MGKTHPRRSHALAALCVGLACALAPHASASDERALGANPPAPLERTPAGLFSDRAQPPAGPAIQGTEQTRGDGEEELLFSQPPVLDDQGVGPRFLIAIATSCPFGAAAAEDFTLERSTELTRVEWEGVYFGATFDWPLPPQNVRLTFYQDDGAGDAAAVLADFDAIDVEFVRHERPPIFGLHPVYTFSATLPESVRIEAGTRYWMAVNVNAAGIFGPAFGWLASPFGNAADTPEFDQPLQTRQTACDALPDVDFIPGSDLGLDADLSLRLFGGCVNDCDCDGVSDAEEIASGEATDCDGDGVPDSCAIASGAAIDCDGDGVIDACQLRVEVDLDSGAMGPLRTSEVLAHDLGEPQPARSDVEITVRAMGDLDAESEFLTARLNGVPLGDLFVFDASECEGVADEETLIIPAETFNRAVNGGPATLTLEASNGVVSFGCGATFARTTVRYAARHPQDCNGNGVPDSCDILSGASNDCNGDFVPDECQIADGLAHRSGRLDDPGHDQPTLFRIGSPAQADSEVSVVVTVRGDFSHSPEYLEVAINGRLVGRLFEQNGADCSAAPLWGETTLSADTFNDLIASGEAVIELRGSETVNPALCRDGFAAVSVQYRGAGMGDCNANGVFDGCEIAQGLGRDRNNNGVLDDCENLGDLNGDGVRNSADVAVLLMRWGTNDPEADLNGDGIINTGDLSLLLSMIGV